MMASVSSLHPGKLVLFTSLSAADLCITGSLLQQDGSSFYEGNPIANAWLNAYGWVGLIVFKAMAISIVIGASALISLSRPKVGGLVLLFACSVVAGVVLYSCSLSRLAEPTATRFHPVHLNSIWPIF